MGDVDMAAAPETPLDRRQMFAVWLTQINQGVTNTLPYTLAVYLVRAFEAADNGSGLAEHSAEGRIGRLTGMLAACNSAAQFLTAFPWGFISDRIGRKPVVLIGNIATGMAVVSLGLVPSYPLALLVRFTGGLFNGTGVAVKTMLGEASDETNQGRAMSYHSLGWGLGSVLGPIMAGALAEPCSHHAGFPLCGDGQLFQLRPFLLPCLVVGCISLSVCLSNIFLMPETLPRLRKTLPQQYQPVTVLEDHDRPCSAEHSEQSAQKEKLKARERSASCSLEMVCIEVAASGQLTDAGLFLDACCRPAASSGPGGVQTADVVPPLRHDSDVGEGRVVTLRSADSCGQSSGRPIVRVDSAFVGTQGDGEDCSVPPTGAAMCGEPAASCEQGGAPHAQSSGGGSCGEPRCRSPEHFMAVGRGSGAGHEQGRGSVQRADHADSLPQSSQRTSSRRGSVDEGEEHAGERISLLPQANGVTGSTEGHLQAELASTLPWYRLRSVQLSVLGYGLIAFSFNCLDELAPLFASAPRANGGLGLSPARFALPLSVGGAALMLYVWLLAPGHQRRNGPLKCCRAGLLLAVPAALAIPATAVAPSANVAAILLCPALAIKSVALIMSMISSNILINSVAPPAEMGRVNGAGQAAAAAMRAAGPLVGGTLWGASVMWGIPGHAFLPFVVAAGLALANRAVYGQLRI